MKVVVLRVIQMLKTFVGIAIVALTAYHAAAAEHGSGIFVPDHVTVSGPYILVQDIFHNLPDQKLGTKTLTNAPDPGKSIALNFGWLAQIAILNNINWQASDPNKQVIITRAGQLISKADINKYINDAFKKKLNLQSLETDSYRYVITPANEQDYYVPITASKEIYVKSLNYDRIQKKFSITFAVPNAPLKNNTIGPVVGKAIKLVPIIVPTHKIMPGDIITPNDVTTIWTDETQTQLGSASSRDQVVGKTTRSPLSDGKQINIHNLQDPILVKQGQLVTIIFNAKGIHLTVTGKALENGSKNSLIRVMNTNSSKVITALVTGPQEVTIKEIM